jgi:hypothetical protein
MDVIDVGTQVICAAQRSICIISQIHIGTVSCHNSAAFVPSTPDHSLGSFEEQVTLPTRQTSWSSTEHVALSKPPGAGAKAPISWPTPCRWTWNYNSMESQSDHTFL